MGKCCQNSGHSTPPEMKNRFVNWLSFGGFAGAVGLLWAFDGNPMVSQFAPAVLLGLILLWLSIAAARKLNILAGRKTSTPQ